MSAVDEGRRVVVVTGASRGFGRAAAMALARTGVHLVLVARTTGALEEVDDGLRAEGLGAPTLVPMDLADSESIEQLGAAIAGRFGRLDGLLAAAGELGILTPVAHLDPKVFARVTETTLFANQRLIRSLDPLLRASPAGRAVFVTGSVGRDRPFWSPFAASRAALEALVRAYAAEVAHSSLRVNLFDPGPMATRLRAQAFPGELPEAVPPPEARTDALLPLLDPACARHGETVSAEAAQSGA